MNQTQTNPEENNKPVEKKKRKIKRSTKEFMKDARDYVERQNFSAEYQIQSYEIDALLMYSRFQAMIKAGFEDNRAWEFIMARGLN